MDTSIYLLIFTIAIALIFDVINGLHDAANSIATIVSTRVLKPQHAVLWAASFNLLAMFLFAPKVAETISHIVKIAPEDINFIFVLLSGLLGGIAWGLLTWWLGLPSSSSHALIGSLAGAALAYGGIELINLDLIYLTAIFIIVSPLLGFIGGFSIMLLNCWLFRKYRPDEIDKLFRKGQLLSAGLYSLGHGANDAQKTMGIIFALLVAAGHITHDTTLSLFNTETWWIVVSCNVCLALGTAMGGWRIVKTMGMKIVHLKPMGGCSAESAGAATLFLATWLGVPVSTTHTITTSIIGAATVVTPLSHIRWSLASRVVWAWILTLPGSGLIGGIIFLGIKALR